ncbi:MAG: hypothetical protein ABI051_11690 [Vicinamibacterales bacterium]
MTTTLLERVESVETALDSLAVALTSGQTREVLRAEEPLAVATAGLTAAASDANVADAALPHAIARVRASMERCRLLGQSVEEFVRALAPQSAYGRAGGLVDHPLTARRGGPIT